MSDNKYQYWDTSVLWQLCLKNHWSMQVKDAKKRIEGKA